jgi:type IV secretory pathway TraG/TraD family ATPase VirD4
MGWWGPNKKEREETFKKLASHNPPKNIETSWATDAVMEALGLFEPNGIPIGYSQESDRPIYYNGSTHGLTLGGTGDGKTTTQLLPMLLSDTLRETSVVCFDTMGELAAVSADYRRRFGPVHIVNPMHMFERELREFIPFACRHCH